MSSVRIPMLDISEIMQKEKKILPNSMCLSLGMIRKICFQSFSQRIHLNMRIDTSHINT